MSQQKKVTQKDIARAAKVHYATVSLSLKNHPSIPERTRNRIKKIAKKLGYIPDPMLSALSVYRNLNRNPAQFQGTLAWLANTTSSYNWKKVPQVLGYYRGAEKRAKELGYNIEQFDLGNQGLSAFRIASILRARNIRGILLGPQPRPRMEVHFKWENFSIVTCGRTLAKPSLHSVVEAHYSDMMLIMREVIKCGYKKIGLIIDSEANERLDYQFLAAYLTSQNLYSQTAIPPLHTNIRYDLKSLKDWYKRYKPDAIVTIHLYIIEILEKIGLKIPDDVGVACAGLDENEPFLSGAIEQSRHLGSAAVDLLTALMYRGEFGVPQTPHKIHIDGVWSLGKSLINKNTH